LMHWLHICQCKTSGDHHIRGKRNRFHAGGILVMMHRGNDDRKSLSCSTRKEDHALPIS
jgi:hypothetical protein